MDSPGKLLKLAIWVFGLGFVGRRWRLPCFAMMGTAAGLLLAVAHVGRASSYLGDDPRTCINCHVMTDAYLSWQNSSHARVTTCNDCHLPHDNPLVRNAFKAKDGLWHSTVFTMRWEPQVIRLSSMAVPVVQGNCLRCHEHAMSKVQQLPAGEFERLCWDCHRDVPHGRVHSLSGTLPTMRPRLPLVLELSDDGHAGSAGLNEGDDDEQ